MLRAQQSEQSIKQFSLITTAAVFLLTVWMAWPTSGSGTPGFALGTAGMQHVVARPWIPSLHIYYMLGSTASASR